MTKPKDPKDYKKRGAPQFLYDDIIGREICDAVATSTEPLAKILASRADFPCETTVRKLRLSYPTFALMYAQAKMMQAELFAEEVIDISDDSSKDVKFDKDGNELCNTEFIARARLRVDTRKWIACKLAPKLYGDKQTIDHNVVPHETTLKDLG